MDTTALVRQAAPVNLPPLARGYIVPTRPAPASLAEGVYVVLPEGSTEGLYGPCKYGALHGSAKPQPGAACVVGFDEQNQPTILWWDGVFAGGGGGTEYFAGEGLELSSIGGKETFKVKALGIVTGMLAALSVTTAKLAEEAVTAVKIAAETIESAQVKLHGLTVNRLKEAELTNAYIKPAAGIEESKLSLPEVVVKTGTQTVTGLKTFESVTGAEEAAAITGAEAVKVVVANGNVNTTSSASPAAGNGGLFKVTTGTGGKTTKATTTQKGGNGGEAKVSTGAGGTVEGEGTVKGTAGIGGPYATVTGAGGNAEVGGGGATVAFTAGAGGLLKFETGAGGKVTGATTAAATAGGGGELKFKTGGGGTAEASAKGAGGAGGPLKFETGGGALGGAEGTNGKGGPVQFVLGNAAVEANWGTFTIYGEKAEASKARFEVGPEGFIKIQKSIGLWEHAPPAAKPASITPEEITVKVAMERIDKVFKEYGITA